MATLEAVHGGLRAVSCCVYYPVAEAILLSLSAFFTDCVRLSAVIWLNSFSTLSNETLATTQALHLISVLFMKFCNIFSSKLTFPFWWLLHDGHICTCESAKSSWRSFAVKRGFLTSFSGYEQFFRTVSVLQTSSCPPWHFNCYALNCYVKMLCLLQLWGHQFILRVRSSCLQEPMVADCWENIWGIRVYVDVWSLRHMTMTVTKAELLQANFEVMVEFSWGHKSLHFCEVLLFIFPTLISTEL